MKKLTASIFTLFIITTIISAQTKRPLNPSDVLRYVDVSDPQISPDGNWCAYVVTKVDTAKDKHVSNIWMVSWDGKNNIQLTNTEKAKARRVSVLIINTFLFYHQEILMKTKTMIKMMNHNYG